MNIKSRPFLIFIEKVFVLLLLILISCNSSRKDNDLTRSNLKGKIKSIQEIYYNGKERFGDVEKDSVLGKSIVLFNKDGNIVKQIRRVEKETLFASNSHLLNVYDERGNLTEKSKFYSDSSLKDKYTYDGENRLIEKSYFDSDGSLKNKSIFKFDNKNRVFEEEEYYEDDDLPSINKYRYDDKGNQIIESYTFEGELNGKEITKYDIKGNIIYNAYYGYTGDLFYENKFKFDQNGNLIESDKSHIMDDYKRERETFIYDDHGKKIESKKFKPNGELGSNYFWKYDSEGNEVEEKSFYYFKNNHGKPFIDSFEYKYDEIGNWTYRVQYKREKHIFISERSIEYY